MKSNEIKSFSCIDIMKFIMAIFVVAIHTNPFVNFQNQYISRFFNNLFQVAVPFFFLATGFLLQKKMECLTKELKLDILTKYILKSLDALVKVF